MEASAEEAASLLDVVEKYKKKKLDPKPGKELQEFLDRGTKRGGTGDMSNEVGRVKSDSPRFLISE